ncbi:glycine zipper 2TM domain-containing protein [Pseudohongiella spirulinae]|uniref:Outer membrane lipoprotein n=1 Tax=Pseudohongiella spirulinae TaxID=1249552 RepID=A0A0S2KFN8_9GAMM|nr:glycine zipper 2TM domain-containing protein [Pseudohongiella spirulinae]ALO46783.1 Outer membrane lipoprotein [Pseudohongiella spirulinae]
MRRNNDKRAGLLVAALSGSALLLSSALANAQPHYVFADVIETRPIYEAVTVSEPREECWNEQIRMKDAHRSDSRTPVLISTIVGGAIGNALGNNKSSQRVGTVVGAVLGHSVGRDIVSANNRPEPVRYQTVQHCEVVNHYRDEERLTGYQVRYLFNGEEYTVHTDRDPGERIRLRVDVVPVL